jgi:uncharacterized protein YggE
MRLNIIAPVKMLSLLRHSFFLKRRTYLFSYALCLLSYLNVSAQNTDNQNFIEVEGSAEKWLLPTEILYQLTLIPEETLYDDDPSKMRLLVAEAKMKVQDTRRKVIELLWKEGIKETDFVHSKFTLMDDSQNNEVVIRITDIKKLESILARLRDTKICTGRILQSLNPNIKEMTTELKMDAYKNAYQQALKLAAVAGVQLGKPLQIKTNKPENFYASDINLSLNRLYSAQLPPLSMETLNGEIKLSESVVVRFAIQ